MERETSERGATHFMSEGKLPFGPSFFRELFDNLYDAVYFVDCERRILFWNRPAERLSGYSAEEVVGNYCHAEVLQHTNEAGCELCYANCPLQDAVDTGEPRCARVFLRHKDGRRIAVDVQVMPVRDHAGKVVGGVEVFRDASATIALENAHNKLRELAHKDPLTGAANRRSLDNLLRDQLETFTRTGTYFSIVLSDIDHFKRVNDGWGHQAGDAVLRYFADCLQEAARRGDLVARFGGEEFFVLMPGACVEGATQLAERLRSAVSQSPLEAIHGGRITASFGVTQVARFDDVESLLGRADRALYQAKRARPEPSVPLLKTDDIALCESAVTLT